METKAISRLLFLLVAPVLGAQQFANVGREAVPRTTGTGGTFLVDLDGDGALDIYFSPNMYWQNDGHGRFTQRALAVPFSFAGLGLATGDFDGDGDQDLVTTGAVLENRGALGPAWTPTSLNYPWVPIAAGDFNGDGKTDLATPAGVAIAINLTTFQTIALGGGTGLSS